MSSPLQAAAEAGLGPLIQRALMLDGLDGILRENLPAALAGQCRLANADKDKLVFLVSTPVWKNKLRLLADVLLDAAAAAGHPARALVIKVAPPAPITPDAISKPLTQAVRDSLRMAARSVEDADLRAQILKLASVR